MLDLRAKNTKATGLKKSNSLQSPFAPQVPNKLPKIALEDQI